MLRDAATDGDDRPAHSCPSAEYRAPLAGLEHARSLGLDRVEARCDAKLVVEHVTGSREPINPRLRELCRAVRDGAERDGTVVFVWVPADANGRAHALVADAFGPGETCPTAAGSSQCRTAAGTPARSAETIR